MNKGTRSNKDLQNTKQKTKGRERRTPPNIRGEFRCFRRVSSSPCPICSTSSMCYCFNLQILCSYLKRGSNRSWDKQAFHIWNLVKFVWNWQTTLWSSIYRPKIMICLKGIFIENIKYIPNTYIVWWYTTVHQVESVVWTSIITSRENDELWCATDKTWYTVL